MNVFHWHISDSQSFPLELPSLPEFSRYGAYSAALVGSTPRYDAIGGDAFHV